MWPRSEEATPRWRSTTLGGTSRVRSELVKVSGRLEGVRWLADIVDAATRSRMMAGISGRNTRPELLTRRYLHARGFRFRLHPGTLPGRPDLVLPKYRAAIFVNGCFWHAHTGCKYFKLPSSRPDFWATKLESNRERDARNLASLEALGWRVAVVWECGVRAGDASFEELCRWLPSGEPNAVIPASPSSALGPIEG
ncbi:very short patch repair endonuclease [Pedococcus bigeumensis]|uniref:very short patch repair endonuclease n=1 Tax=Pedococcus bigeumensis TaxID=433644 RepID=UPI0031CFF7A9